MRPTSLILAFSAAALAGAPAIAAGEPASPPVYKSRLDQSGILHLTGYDEELGKRFHYRVRKSGYVVGRVGSSMVTFRVAPQAWERETQKLRSSTGS